MEGYSGGTYHTRDVKNYCPQGANDLLIALQSIQSHLDYFADRG